MTWMMLTMEAKNNIPGYLLCRIASQSKDLVDVFKYGFYANITYEVQQSWWFKYYSYGIRTANRFVKLTNAKIDLT